MTIRKSPAEAVILDLYCDVKGCGLAMQRVESQYPDWDAHKAGRAQYLHQCPNQHQLYTKHTYPRWEILRPKKK